MPVAKELLEILVCPQCKSALQPIESGEALDCLHCRLRYEVREGIPIMLVSEAKKI